MSQLAGYGLRMGVLSVAVFVAFSMPAQTPKWQEAPGFRLAPLSVPAQGRSGFTQVPNSQASIRFTNVLSFAKASVNQNLLNGAGLATGDYDGDGLCDLYFCNLEGRNALYRNLGGWKFADMTEAAGVACAERSSTGATFADVDGDGRLDLIVVANGGMNVVFMNAGDGRFIEKPLPSGLVSRTGSTSIALADVDGDGDLDLYIANYGENSILRSGGLVSTRMVNGREEVVGRYRNRIKIIDGKMYEFGEPHVLYLNDGRGNFTPTSWTDGRFRDEDGKPLTEAPWDEGLSVQFRDLNRDGSPDIYVCNDFQMPDRIWLNDGKGQFRAIERLALRQTCNFSMTADVADINRDDHDDFLVADMLSRFHELRMRQMDGSLREPRVPGRIDDRPQIRRNVLQLSRGDGTYAEIANLALLDASDWTWCVVWLDVDLDGFEDLVIGNGHAYDTQDLDTSERIKSMGRQSTKEKQDTLKLYPMLPTPNMIFRNRGDLTFEEMGSAWGYDSRQVTHAIALADLDDDGDLDLALNCLNAPPLLYRNDSVASRIGVRLKGLPPNREGIGARVTLRGGAVPLQSQEIISGGHYLSGSDPLRVFAAGTAPGPLTLEVRWRSGKQSTITAVKANHLYEISEAAASPAASTVSASRKPPLFTDVSGVVAHTHPEVAFNDYERQPLLHRNYSQLGPGVAWSDFGADGHDGLVLGTGRGGMAAVFRGDGRGALAPWDAPAWKEAALDDWAGMAAWAVGPGRAGLVVAQANYESGPNMPSTIMVLDPGASGPKVVARNSSASLGPLATADYDGDGDLDLFAGGRVIAARYPEPPGSTLYRMQGGNLHADADTRTLFAKVGLVSGAVWSDLAGDGLPELVLACEWGPLRVFENHNGKLREATAELGLLPFVGWWSSVTAGDFDGDGRMDLVAGNWGLNSSYYRPTPQDPVRLYYGDFDGNDTLDLLEAWSDRHSGKIVPRRDLQIMGVAVPGLRTRLPTHAAYSQADPQTIIGATFSRVQQVQASTLASMVFLNRGARFEPIQLPPEAQFAPVFGLSVADWDGDGCEDIFLAQNFFAMRPEEARLDAGRGLLLRGDGKGSFVALSGQESGLTIYGEQRGSAVADFNEDGRADLAVAQNAAPTKLYRNDGGRPGVRVRLQGPPGNPHGIGAAVRIGAGEALGPARELHGGSGYWSQDSTTLVLASPGSAARLWVRWPGGRTSTQEIASGTREVLVK